MNPQPIPLTPEEIPLMRRVCKKAARVLREMGSHIEEGISTGDLDRIAVKCMSSMGVSSACLGYRGFPKSICTSVNDVICHGVPDSYVLRAGDIINIDVTCLEEGFFGDTSATFYVNESKVAPKVHDLVEHSKEAMYRGITAIRPHGSTGDIGFAIDKYATKRGLVTVKDIGGHGIGKFFHQEPFVPNFGKKGRGDILIPWTCITVEPMLNENDLVLQEKPIPNSNVSCYKTADGSFSAQFEHTVLITNSGYEILTEPE